MKLAICNEMFESWTWERTCEFARALGYEGLEVAPFTLGESADAISPSERRRLRDAAESRGIELLGLHWLLVQPPGLYVTHPDRAVRQKTAGYFVSLVNLCADLGGKVMVVGSPKQRSLLPGVTREQADTFAMEVFLVALDAAAKRGVTLAIEPLGPEETDYLRTVDEALALVRKLAHPNFQLNLDVKAMSTESKSIPDVIRSARGHIAHVQVNDPNRLGPGMGQVKFEPIVAALREVGYDGWLSVEAFDYRPGVEAIAQRSIAYLRELINRSLQQSAPMKEGA